ncbi:hypothetical protein LINGRAHAP2_LOCUS26812 [Linum grandiflorum]
MILMASYGQAQALRKKELPRILRNKNLYFGCMWNTRIIGIRIEPSTDEIGSLGEETPDIIENPVFLGKWNILSDHGLPVGMSMLVMDSKLYMIGGEYINDRHCLDFHSEENFSNGALPESAYEFAIAPKPNFDNFSISSSLPQLPTAMVAPIIIKHWGEIYVLYGEDVQGYRWPPRERRSILENRFLVLRNRGHGCMKWESIPLHPLCKPSLTCKMWSFYGSIGSGLYIQFGGIVWCYDTNKEQWEEKSHDYRIAGLLDSITLSSLSVPTTYAEGRPSYVVIFPTAHEMSHKITAALVDGDGRASRFQLIHEARGVIDDLTDFKLIELEESEEEKELKDCSSTFALVFAPDVNVIGLTVIRVSLLRSFFEVEDHRDKRQKLSAYKEDDFLKVEVLLNQRYITKGEFDFEECILNDAFFA